MARKIKGEFVLNDFYDILINEILDINSNFENVENYKENNARLLITKDKIKNPHLYPNECCICRIKNNIEFHHPNYDFPYSVYPLCKKHHIQIHNNINKNKKLLKNKN